MLEPAAAVVVLNGATEALQGYGSAAQRSTSAAALLAELAPQSATEGLLAAQMIATHHAALTMLCRATIREQPTEIVDQCVTRAVRLQRVFLEQTAALAKLRGQGTQQRVAVEHRHVHVHTTAEAARATAADGVTADVPLTEVPRLDVPALGPGDVGAG